MKYTISDAVTLTGDVQNDEPIRGEVRLYNVDKEETDDGVYENDPEKFFNRTALTDGLEKSLLGLRDALTAKNQHGAHKVYGPYGTGKSHQLTALYHTLDNPHIARDWLQSKGLDDVSGALPNDATVVQYSMQYDNPGSEETPYIWSKLLNALDAEPFNPDENKPFPDASYIEDVIGDEHVFVFFDEIESWYDALSDRERERARMFLQALLTAAKDHQNLLVFISLLDPTASITDIIDRFNTISVNVTTELDKKKVLQHRFVDTVDEDVRDEIIDAYLDTYDDSNDITVDPDDKERFQQAYPLHPDLVDDLNRRYYAGRDQSVRGMLYLFANVLDNLHDETGLITAGDIDPREYQTDLSPLAPDRIDVAVTDLDAFDPTDASTGVQRLFHTTVLYSLNPGGDEDGATVERLLRGTLTPDHRPSEIYVTLEKHLMKEFPHVHALNGREKYIVQTQMNVPSRIRKQAQNVSLNEAQHRISEEVNGFFTGSTHTVYFENDDEIDDHDWKKDPELVIAPEQWTTEMANNVIHGRRSQNTFVFIEPETPINVSGDSRTVDRARYLIAVEELRDNSERFEEQIYDRLEEEQEIAKQELREALGREWNYVNPIETPDQIETTERRGQITDADTDGKPYNADAIFQHVTASPPDLIDPLESYLAENAPVDIQTIYDHFADTPTLPFLYDYDSLTLTISMIPEYEFFDGRGFIDEEDVTDTTTVVPQPEEVTLEEVQETLFNNVTENGIVELRDIYHTYKSDPEVKIANGRDTVQNATKTLISGHENIDSPQDAIPYHEIYDTEQIREPSKEEVVDTIKTKIRSQYSASLEDVKEEFEESGEYIVIDSSPVKEAAGELVTKEYAHYTDGEFNSNTDGITMKSIIYPTPSERLVETVEDNISYINSGHTITPNDIGSSFTDSDVDEEKLAKINSALKQIEVGEHHTGVELIELDEEQEVGYEKAEYGAVFKWNGHNVSSPEELAEEIRETVSKDDTVKKGNIHVKQTISGLPKESLDEYVEAETKYEAEVSFSSGITAKQICDTLENIQGELKYYLITFNND